ncbi:hypothetical protein VTJ49DRAFT_7094 [Mycothermus thermophilus]|uniref:Uncharacterized protein n=1 Tax=Humicola insolens TaxID=85995 RepID=A0ABR3VI61_HUMIN
MGRPSKAAKAAVENFLQAPDGAAVVHHGDTATPADLRFAFALMTNLTVRPEVNWAGVAAQLGMSSSKSANERYRLVRKRLGLLEFAQSPNAPAAPQEGSKKKAVAAKNSANKDGLTGQDDDEKEDLASTLSATPTSVASAVPAAVSTPKTTLATARNRNRKRPAAVDEDADEGRKDNNDGDDGMSRTPSSPLAKRAKADSKLLGGWREDGAV